MCFFWQNLEIVMVFTFYGKNFGKNFSIFFMKTAGQANIFNWFGHKLWNSSAHIRTHILDILVDEIQSF